MELNNSKPVFVQIRDYYHSLISKGLLEEGEPLPSVREVAAFFKVNPNTVQRAFSMLADEGYILNVPKKGFFVKKKDDDHRELIKKAINELRDLGIEYDEIERILEEMAHDRN